MISVIRKIITAHKWCSSNELISTAIFKNDSLIVFDCNLSLFRIPFSSLSPLKKSKYPTDQSLLSQEMVAIFTGKNTTYTLT